MNNEQRASLYRLLRRVGLGAPIETNTYAAVRSLRRLRLWQRARRWDRLAPALAELAPDEYSAAIEALRDWPGAPSFINKWVDAKPSQADAWLVRGAHLIAWAWEVRGSSPAERVPTAAWVVFAERLEQAEQNLQRAARLAPRNPEPYHYLIQSGMGLGLPAHELFGRFAALKARNPIHYRGHTQMLLALTQKRGGSHREMFEFARASTRAAPEGCGLYALLAQAHIEYWDYLATIDDDRVGAVSYIRSAAVGDELRSAYELSLGSPNFVPTAAVTAQRSIFAMAFYLAGELQLACDEIGRLGARAEVYPWQYLASRPWDYLNTGYVIGRVRRELRRLR